MTNLQKVIGRYIDAAIRHRAATDVGDSNAANRAHDQLIDALLQIRATESGRVTPLTQLLTHSNPGVRCWAATHLLWETPDRAMEVLNAIVDVGGALAFDARMVLQEWQNGNLQPPWDWH